MKKPIKLITSFFYLGHSPFVPGTIGSLGGLVLYFLVKNNEILYGFTILFLFVLGIIFAGEAERIYKRKDARMIVIDEVCGMLISLYFVPFSIFSVVLGFFLFRLFDILKPWPAKKMEEMSGALGIMVDDVVVAVYTNIILQLIFRRMLC